MKKKPKSYLDNKQLAVVTMTDNNLDQFKNLLHFKNFYFSTYATTKCFLIGHMN